MKKNHLLLIMSICLFSIGLACIVMAGYVLAGPGETTFCDPPGVHHVPETPNPAIRL